MIIVSSHHLFCNFARILSYSLSKGSLGNWRKTGLRIGNHTQFHILLWIAFKEHPTVSHQPFYDSSSGAKVNNSSERAKSIHIFFFWACSSLISYTAASFVAPAIKVRIRLRPITQWQCGYPLAIVIIFLSNEYWTIEFVNKPLFIW